MKKKRGNSKSNYFRFDRAVRVKIKSKKLNKERYDRLK